MEDLVSDGGDFGKTCFISRMERIRKELRAVAPVATKMSPLMMTWAVVNQATLNVLPTNFRMLHVTDTAEGANAFD